MQGLEHRTPHRLTGEDVVSHNFRLRRWCAVAWSLAFCASALAAEPIVIGQSLASGTDPDMNSGRLMDGIKAYVAHVNSNGGIQGRPLALVSLDDENRPERHARNLRELASKHKAVAFIGCANDQICAVAAKVAEEVRVPLIGAFSGAQAMMRKTGDEFLFPTRPRYDKEAEALVGQAIAMGLSRLAVVTGTAADNERLSALLPVLAKHKMQATVVRIDSAQPASARSAIQALERAGPQGVIMDLDNGAINFIADQNLQASEVWPRLILTFASSSLVSVANVFKGKFLGFTSVVPNAEVGSLRIVRDLQRDVERIGAPHAISFEGLQNYMSARIVAEGLLRTTGKPTGEKLAVALKGLSLDLGGFKMSFANGRETGSDWVEVGVRSRDGVYLK